ASQRTLQPEDGTHLVEHVGGHIGLDVDAETRFEASVEELLDRGHPMSHHHLHGRGDRYRPTAVDDHMDLDLHARGAVDVGRVRAEQPCLPHLLDLAVLPVAADADVGRYAGTGLPGQLPVVTGHLEVGELGTGSRQGQGEALVFAREVLGGTAYEPA